MIFTAFCFFALDKIYGDEQFNSEKLILSLLRQSIYEPLSLGDQVEVSRRLNSIKENSNIQNLCIASDNFLFLKCSDQNDFKKFSKINITIPSMNSDFVILVQFNNKSYLNKFFWIIIPFFIFIFLIFFLGKFILNIFEKYLIDDLKIFSESLKNKKMVASFNSKEFRGIKEAFLESLNNLNYIEVSKMRIALSQKLAHDIRSPISTLNLISSKIEDLEIRTLQLAVVDQINTIANNLLDQTKTDGVSDIVLGFSEMLFNLEKEYQFKSTSISQKITFKINYDSIQNKKFSSQLNSIIYSTLNNLIQNSIEATSKNGVISISVGLNTDHKIEVSVSDNGKGIPPEILKRLGKEVLTFGKNKENNGSSNLKSGNGIALFNAKKELAENNIELLITSKQNLDTTVKIII